MTVLFLLLSAASVLASNVTDSIKVDQVGYALSGPKVALVSGNVNSGAEFYVVRVSDGVSVFNGVLSASQVDGQSGDSLRKADFSLLNDTGSFYINIPTLGSSYSFNISTVETLLTHPLYASMRAFYGWRCGTAVSFAPEHPQFSHKKCHTSEMISIQYHSSTGKSGPASAVGGWHDAGDFGKYVVTQGVAVGSLLHAYELFGKSIGSLTLNIPETGGELPDMLAEIKWALNWLLMMQDDDGGVWVKQTSADFASYTMMPEDDKATSFVIGTDSGNKKGTCATAQVAAVGALASRIYKEFDSTYANTLLSAAKKAYGWASANPSEYFEANPAGILTGVYPDIDCRDEIFWAAAELFRTTGDKDYKNYVEDNYKSFATDTVLHWQRTAPLGLWSYVFADPSKTEDLRRSILEDADGMVTYAAKNGYLHPMRSSDYVWGSNSELLNKASHLMVAYKMSGNIQYVQTALEGLHYVFGRNTFSTSFVTLLGSKYPMVPHLRQANADGIEMPWPGYMVGGPNRNKEDPIIKQSSETFPARLWVDVFQSYATNEVAINWNSPLVFVLAGAIDSEKNPTPVYVFSDSSAALTIGLSVAGAVVLIASICGYCYWRKVVAKKAAEMEAARKLEEKSRKKSRKAKTNLKVSRKSKPEAEIEKGESEMP